MRHRPVQRTSFGRRRAVLLLAIASCAFQVARAADDPQLRPTDRALSETVRIPEGTVTMTIWLLIGPDGVTVNLQPPDGAPRALTLRPFDASLPASGDAEAVVLPDAGIELVELRLRRYLRPNPAMLKGPAREDCVRNWADLPGAAERAVALTFTEMGADVECYLDGRYAGKVLESGTLASVEFVLSRGSALGPPEFGAAPRDPAFHPVDLRPADQPGALAGAAVALADSPEPGGIPFVTPTGANLDLGLTAGHQDRYASYTYRSAFDGLDGSFIFSVPGAQYIRAWVLCAVEGDRAKDPALTARLTRFVAGGSYTGRARDCLADTTAVLPRGGEEPADAVTRVGTVAAGGRELPLYLVEVPLASGDIQDLLFYERGERQRGTLRIGPYLDFELLGRLRPQDRPHPFNDDRLFPDRTRVSGVHVFGLTLERTPVEMEIRPTRPGNVFHNDELPEMQVALRPRVGGRYTLRWTIDDVDGAPVATGERALELAADAAEETVVIPLARPDLGWYAIEVALWQGERALLSHQASFALLGPDTRQAGYESPYGTWWFDHHYGTADPQTIGPLLLKAGFRRAAYATARHTEEELAPWKVTAPAVSWGALRDPAATDEQLLAAIRDTVTRYPHCDALMIFHESMPNAPLGTRSAPELFGLPVSEYPGAEERWAHANRLARLVRANFSELKIYIGNSGASSELIAEGLRRGFPRELADYIGIETVGRTGHPEKLWEGGLPGVWLLREIARRYDYDWPVTSCYETNYRHDRLLGEQRQAEWYVRDALLSHAYRFPYISIALLHDVGNSYHAGFWGATGLCHRFPLLYPKRSYVAMATLTRVLDRVELQREVPTGSNCVYALEFTRADGRFVYPLWTARGTCELALRFPTEAAISVIDLYGRERPLPAPSGQLNLTASGAVQYVVSSQALGTVHCGRRAYPEDQPPAGFQVVQTMDRAEDWELVTDPDPLLEQTSEPHLAFRTAGEFALRAVTDDERGPCLEIELQSPLEPATPLLSRYGVLRLKRPVTLPGEPTTLGMWVRGNSGWGEVYWELEDAAGVRRISCGTTVHDADVFDYDGRVALNFDGWAFLSFPITDRSPIPDLSTGAVSNLWQATDRSKAVTYPVTLTGVAFSLPPQALHLTEMTPLRQVIRLGGTGAF